MIKPGSLIVSAQAQVGSPLRKPDILAAIAAEAVAAGAAAVRVQGIETILAVTKVVNVPVIGLIKTDRYGFDMKITAIADEVEAIAHAGAKIVAIDATDRIRPEPLNELFERARECKLEIFADIATLAEGAAAQELGATYIGTTMAGYTAQREMSVGPDFELLEQLVAAMQTPIILEGRVSTKEQLEHGFALGAHAVVVGRAITSPRTIIQSLLGR
jgi:N-acylglucosamine-6-phosphate 2-epimerase